MHPLALRAPAPIVRASVSRLGDNGIPGAYRRVDVPGIELEEHSS